MFPKILVYYTSEPMPTERKAVISLAVKTFTGVTFSFLNVATRRTKYYGLNFIYQEVRKLKLKLP